VFKFLQTLLMDWMVDLLWFQSTIVYYCSSYKAWLYGVNRQFSCGDVWGKKQHIKMNHSNHILIFNELQIDSIFRYTVKLYVLEQFIYLLTIFELILIFIKLSIFENNLAYIYRNLLYLFHFLNYFTFILMFINDFIVLLLIG